MRWLAMYLFFSVLAKLRLPCHKHYFILFYSGIQCFYNEDLSFNFIKGIQCMRLPALQGSYMYSTFPYFFAKKMFSQLKPMTFQYFIVSQRSGKWMLSSLRLLSHKHHSISFYNGILYFSVML